MLTFLKKNYGVGPGGVTLWQLVVLLCPAALSGDYWVQAHPISAPDRLIAAGAVLTIFLLLFCVQVSFDCFVVRYIFIVLNKGSKTKLRVAILCLHMLAPFLWLFIGLWVLALLFGRSTH